MGKTLKKKTQNEDKSIINVLNFEKDSSFFFDVTKIYPCLLNIKDYSSLIIDSNEVKLLSNKINEIRLSLNQRKIKYKEIQILDEFKKHLDEMQHFDNSKSTYAKRIKNIISSEKTKSNKVITLTKIRNIYIDKYKKNISLSAISKVMRRHLGLHFKRITIKNSKLNKRNYQIMQIIFLKALLRAIKIGIDIIYIDETACYLQNNNFKDWVGKNEELIKGPETGTKEKINIVMAIDINGIIDYKITDTNINSKVFGEFIDDLYLKLNEKQKINSLIIFDNATCHKTKEIIEKCKNKKLKILTNIPYKSNYNGIEFFFGFFKNEYYKFIYKNKKDQKSKIIEILESNNIKENASSFFLQVFDNYLRDIKVDEEEEKRINNLFKELVNDDEDDLSKSFEE